MIRKPCRDTARNPLKRSPTRCLGRAQRAAAIGLAGKCSHKRDADGPAKFLDFIPIDIIPIVALLAEGRQPVTFGGWSKVRRPRAWLVTTHSGGVGAPPGGTTAPRQELADDREKVPAKARPGAETRTPRWSAERRAGQRHWPVIPGDPGIGPNRKAGQRVRRSAPAPVGAPPSLDGGTGRRRTRRRPKNTGERSVGYFSPPPLAGEVARPKAVAGEGPSHRKHSPRRERGPHPASPASGGGEETNAWPAPPAMCTATARGRRSGCSRLPPRRRPRSRAGAARTARGL
jgi:hypothetical protein